METPLYITWVKKITSINKLNDSNDSFQVRSVVRDKDLVNSTSVKVWMSWNASLHIWKMVGNMGLCYVTEVLFKVLQWDLNLQAAKTMDECPRIIENSCLLMQSA